MQSCKGALVQADCTVPVCIYHKCDWYSKRFSNRHMRLTAEDAALHCGASFCLRLTAVTIYVVDDDICKAKAGAQYGRDLIG